MWLVKTLGRKNCQDPRNGWLSFDGDMIRSVWLLGIGSVWLLGSPD